MAACLRWSVLLVCVALGCSGRRTVVAGDGPPFATVYPSVAELLASEDPEGARLELAWLTLPDTREHHDALLAALRGAERLDVESLRLLLAAVCFTDSVGSITTITIDGDTTVIRSHVRGEGRWSHVADTLLEEGLARLADVDLRELARLLGHAESDDVLERLWDEYGAPLDDGSARVITTLADGMQGRDALQALLVEVLLPRGGLSGERADAALLALSFDGQRLSLARRLVASRETLDVDTLLTWSSRLGYDSSRLELLDDGVERLGEVGGDDVQRMLEQLSYDSSREGLMRRLVDADVVRLAPAALPERLRAFSYDSTRGDMLRALLPTVVGELPVDVAAEVLRALSYDSTRLEAIRVLRPRLAEASASELEGLLELLSYDSSRRDARRVLGIEEQAR